jgi:hypothetical protein
LGISFKRSLHQPERDRAEIHRNGGIGEKMAILGFLGKKAKPNLTPPVEYPRAAELYFNSDTASKGGYSLRDLVSNRLKGQGLGFGEDFVSKTSNPVIAQREATFKNKTMPFLSNQLSARGVSRSAGNGLATGIINEAELSKNRDIDEIYSKMYLLNKQQEKADTSEAIGLGENLNAQEAGMLRDRAAASERLTTATAADAYKRQEDQDKGNSQLLGLGMTVAAPFVPGGATDALGSSMSMMGGGLYDGDISNYANMNTLQLLKMLQGGGGFNALGAKGGNYAAQAAQNPALRAPADYYKR